VDRNDFLDEAIAYEHFQEMKDVNKSINSAIEEFKSNPPSEKKVCEIAVMFETSSFELHYQKLLQENTKGPGKVFKELNNGDRDHVRRRIALDS